MQVTNTLIAAQQAAAPAAAKVTAPRPGFTAALDKAAGENNFQPLPLKQAAPATPAVQAPVAERAARPGTQLDLTI